MLRDPAKVIGPFPQKRHCQDRLPTLVQDYDRFRGQVLKFPAEWIESYLALEFLRRDERNPDFWQSAIDHFRTSEFEFKASGAAPEVSALIQRWRQQKWPCAASPTS